MSKFFVKGGHYLVLGASTNPAKFGNIVLKWYVRHGLPVTPINPASDKVENLQASTSIIEFLNAKGNENLDVSISVIVPPAIALKSFQEVENAGLSDRIKAIWFQPGAFDSKVVDYVKQLGITNESLIADGECILVTGATRQNEAYI